MGNCNSGRYQNLGLLAGDENSRGSPDKLDSKHHGFSPPGANRIGAKGAELSPITLTPPHLRSRMVGAEVFQPRPQSELDVASPMIEGRGDIGLEAQDEEDAYIGDISVHSAAFLNVENSIASPMAVATAESSGDRIPPLKLTESSMIHILTIESKLCTNKSPSKSPVASASPNAFSGRQADKPSCFTASDNNAAFVPRSSGKERRNKRALHVNATKHKMILGCAIVLLLCFYSVSIACVGWLGIRGLKSAKLIFLPQTRLPSDPSHLLGEHRRIAASPPLLSVSEEKNNIEQPHTKYDIEPRHSPRAWGVSGVANHDSFLLRAKTLVAKGTVQAKALVAKGPVQARRVFRLRAKALLGRAKALKLHNNGNVLQTAMRQILHESSNLSKIISIKQLGEELFGVSDGDVLII